MNKEFVPYEQAVALKELGFDEPCFGYYSFGDELILDKTEKQMISDGCCLSLTYRQAFKWLRDKHNLISNVESLHYGCELKMNRFFYKIVEKSGVGSYDTYDTYEEAEFACVKKLIEIVKTKK